MTTDADATLAAIDAAIEWAPGEPGPDAMSTVLSPMECVTAWADALTDLDDRKQGARYRRAEAHAPIWLDRLPGDRIECLGCGQAWPCGEFDEAAGREA